MALVAGHVFFDIGGTLGDPRLSPPPLHRLEKLDVYPEVPAALEELRQQGARLGIISNIGEVTPEQVAAVHAALRDAEIDHFFAPDLLVFGRKDNPEIFSNAAGLAGVEPGRCVFVGEDAAERQFAAAAGMRVAPHPSLAITVARGERLRYLRIDAPQPVASAEWRRSLLRAGVVPLHVTGSGGSVVYAIAGPSAVSRTMNMRFIVQPLGRDDDPAVTDLYLLRDNLAARTGFLEGDGQASVLLSDPEKSDWLLASSMEGLYIALPGNQSIDALHLPVGMHGHNLKLPPDVTLLQPFGSGPNMRAAAFIQPSFAERDPTAEELSSLAGITAEGIGELVDRFAGAVPLDGAPGSTVRTRHSASDDNGLVVEAIARELEAIGQGAFDVRLHAFSFGGRTLHNVEAEWRGSSEGLVIVSAHLDSTAAASHGAGSTPYRPAADPAPGADDDASGVAAVLAIARALRGMPVNQPRHTLRFVLFNAEEQGLVGSTAYARAQSNAAAPIVAVYQLDMVGTNNVPPALFEIHAGYSPSPDVEAQSLVLARRLERLVPLVSSSLHSPEVSQTRGPGPDQHDGAEGRSDHAAFHARGYAACCVSEDLFMNDPGMPAAEGNEHYHKESDTRINTQYAADIARVVAAAAWLTAHP